MCDLISRQAALKPFCVAPDGTRIPEVDCNNFPVEFNVEFIKKHLLSLPSEEPKIKCVAQIRIDRDDIEGIVNKKVNEIVDKMVKPKIGEWVWNDKGYFHCDQCGKKPNDQTRVTNFCPNCGSFNGGKEK